MELMLTSKQTSQNFKVESMPQQHTPKAETHLFIDGNGPVAEADALAEALRPPGPCLVMAENNVVTMRVVKLQGAVRSHGGQISYHT